MFRFFFTFLMISLSVISYSQDFVLDGKDSVMYGDYTFNNITLQNGASITVATYEAGTQKGKLVLRASTIIINAGCIINASWKGNSGLSTLLGASGAGHGGTGGRGGTAYGDELGNSINMGAKGDNANAVGGMGGGAITLICNTLSMSGKILADAQYGTGNGSNYQYGAGGGSGGGVLINCKNIFSEGLISANGSYGGNGGWSGGNGGGGGGGRVKIFYVTKNITGNITVNGGICAGGNGGNGTIAFDKYPDSPSLLKAEIKNNIPVFPFITTDADSATTLFHKIEVSKDTFKTIFTTYSQLLDPAGWSKLKYKSGDTVQYVCQEVLPFGRYQWRAYAYDQSVWSDGWNWKVPFPTNYSYGEFDITTDVETSDPQDIKSFLLKQNYPNPFNPSTVISFVLPASGKVTLKVFNVLGNEITTLVNEEKSAGQHDVTFNAAGLPSGVYFYKLCSGNFTATKKFILMK